MGSRPGHRASSAAAATCGTGECASASSRPATAATDAEGTISTAAARTAASARSSSATSSRLPAGAWSGQACASARVIIRGCGSAPARRAASGVILAASWALSPG